MSTIVTNEPIEKLRRGEGNALSRRGRSCDVRTSISMADSAGAHFLPSLFRLATAAHDPVKASGPTDLPWRAIQIFLRAALLAGAPSTIVLGDSLLLTLAIGYPVAFWLVSLIEAGR